MQSTELLENLDIKNWNVCSGIDVKTGMDVKNGLKCYKIWM